MKGILVTKKISHNICSVLIVSALLFPLLSFAMTKDECEAKGAFCNTVNVDDTCNGGYDRIGMCNYSTGAQDACCKSKDDDDATDKDSCEKQSGTCSARCEGGSHSNGRCSASEWCCVGGSPPQPSSYEYTPLEPLFTGDDENKGDLVSYIQSIFKFLIWTVGIAALLMMMIGGFMYMTSAGNQANAGTAKKIITDALLGLLVVLFAWVLLNLINPDLVKLNLDSVGALKVKLKQDSYPPHYTPSNTPYTPNPQSPLPLPDPTDNSGNCQGLQVRGINPDQCKDVSDELGDFLACLQGKLPNARINSISDDDATNNLARCQGANYSQPPCDHTKNSCHYGGKAQRNVSCAVDISTTSGASYDQIMAAAQGCRYGYAKDERSSNHVHFSVPGCDCK